MRNLFNFIKKYKWLSAIIFSISLELLLILIGVLLPQPIYNGFFELLIFLLPLVIIPALIVGSMVSLLVGKLFKNTKIQNHKNLIGCSITLLIASVIIFVIINLIAQLVRTAG